MKTVLLLLFTGLTATAAVFVKIPKTPSAVFEKAGGNAIYSGKITVNGGSGSLDVYGFGDSPDSIGATLEQSLGIKNIATACAKGETVVFDWPTGGYRVVLASGSAETSLAFAVKLPLENESAPVWPWGDINIPGGVELTFSASSESGFSMASGTMAAVETAARSIIDDSLRSSGWETSSPAAPVLSSAIFSKGTEILVRTVVPDSDGSRIAMFRRRLREKN